LLKPAPLIAIVPLVVTGVPLTLKAAGTDTATLVTVPLPPPPPPLLSIVTLPSPLSVNVMLVPATKSSSLCTTLFTLFVCNVMPIGVPLPPVLSPPTAHTAGISQALQSQGTSNLIVNATPVTVFFCSSIKGSNTTSLMS